MPRLRSPRLWLRIVGVVALVLAGLGAFLYFAPQYVARWVANHYLRGLNVDVTGVETVGIDIYRGELWFGPVSFTSGAAPPGKVERLGLNVDLLNIFKRRAVVDTLVIEGIDLVIRQRPEGGLTLNGVPIGGPRPEGEPAKEPAPAEPEGDRGSVWDTGLERFEIRDSQALFVSAAGGEIGTHIASLTMEGFRSWEPDKPGAFSLTGDANGIAIVAKGEARPFARPIRALVDWSVNGVTIDRVERFTGPLGLAKRDGALDLTGKTDAAIQPGGEIDIAGDGSAKISGIAIDKSDVGAFSLDDMMVRYSGEYRLSAAADSRFAGTIDLDANAFRMTLADGARIAAARATLAPKPLSVAVSSGGRAQLDGSPTFTVEGLEAGAPAGGATLSSFVLDLAAVRFVADGPALTLGATGRAVAQTIAADAKPLAATSTEITADFKEIAVELNGADASLAGDLAIRAAAPGVTIAGEGGKAPTTARAATIALDAPTLTATSRGGAVEAKATVTAGANDVAATAPGANGSMTASLAEITFNGRDVAAKLGTDGALAASGALSLRLGATAAGVESPRAAAPQEQRRAGRAAQARRPAAPAAAPSSGAATELKLAGLTIDAPQFSAASKGGALSLGGPIRAQIDGVSARSAEPAQLQPEVDVKSLALRGDDVSFGVKGAVIDARARVGLDLDGIKGRWLAAKSVPDADRQARAAVERLRLSLSPAQARVDGEKITASTAGGLDIEDVKVVSADLSPYTRGEVAIANVRTAFREAAFEQASEPKFRARIDMTTRNIESGGSLRPFSRIKIEGFDVADFRVDEKPSVAIDRVTLRRPEIAFGRELIEALTTPAVKVEVQQAEKRVREELEGQPLAFKLNSFHLASGADIRFRDTKIEPTPTFNLAIESLDVQNVDTTSPGTRTDLLFRGKLNEFTPIQASGWAQIFAKPQSFDLVASVQNLELPPLSPYSSSAVGVNLESGKLTVDADARADRGALAGKLLIDVRNLELAGSNAAAAGAIGMPVQSAVGLLKDSSGRIQLTIPISGDLASPSFDIGGVIRQALAGAVTAAATAPFRMALMPVDLLAGAVSGGPPKFQPLVFAPNEKTLGGDADRMVDGLATLLKDRRQLSVRVCGQATAADEQEALRKRPPPASEPERGEALARTRAHLEALAQDRALAVRSALVNDQGVPDAQVGQCRSSFDANDSGPPRVEIRF